MDVETHSPGPAPPAADQGRAARRTPEPTARVRPLEWPSVLCLDAPLVALLWQEAAARGLGAELSWAHRFLLAAAVWLIYQADHWLDGRRLRRDRPALARHRFARRHAPLLVGLGAALAAASAFLAPASLSPPVLIGGAALGLASAGYLVMMRKMRRVRRFGLVKEILSSLIFAAGVFLVPLAPAFAGEGARSPAIAATCAAGLLFAVLCWVNMLQIGRAERQLDALQNQISSAQTLNRAIPRIILILVILVSAFSIRVGSHLELLSFNLLLAAFLLLALDFTADRLPRRVCRLLADVALLAPLVFML